MTQLTPYLPAVFVLSPSSKAAGSGQCQLVRIKDQVIISHNQHFPQLNSFTKFVQITQFIGQKDIYPKLLLKAGSAVRSEQVAQGFSQTGLESLQRRRLYTHSRELVWLYS